MDIREAAVFTPEEQQALFGWGDNIWETASLGLTYRAKETHFVLTVEGRLASHAALLQAPISVNRSPATVAGLGGVVTIPWAQGRGCGRALVQHTMNVFRGWKVDGGLLFCIPKRIRFYEHLGWQLVDVPVTIQQGDRAIPSPLHVMVLPFTDRLRAIERIDLNSLPW